MPSNLNETVTTSESGSNVASVFPKSLVNSNSEVAMNHKDHSGGDTSSCLGSLFSPSTVMWKKRTRLLLQLNLVPMWQHEFQSLLSKTILWLLTLPKIVLCETSKVLGVHHFHQAANVMMPSNLNELFITSESGSILATIIPKSSVNSNPTFEINAEVIIVRAKSSWLGSPFFTKHCHAHKWKWDCYCNWILYKCGFFSSKFKCQQYSYSWNEYQNQYSWRKVKFMGYTFLPSIVKQSHLNETVTRSASGSGMVSLVPKSSVNSNNGSQFCGQQVKLLGYTMLAKHCHAITDISHNSRIRSFPTSLSSKL